MKTSERVEAIDVDLERWVVEIRGDYLVTSYRVNPPRPARLRLIDCNVTGPGIMLRKLQYANITALWTGAKANRDEPLNMTLVRRNELVSNRDEPLDMTLVRGNELASYVLPPQNSLAIEWENFRKYEPVTYSLEWIRLTEKGEELLKDFSLDAACREYPPLKKTVRQLRTWLLLKGPITTQQQDAFCLGTGPGGPFVKDFGSSEPRKPA